jgi:arylsulfatase A
VPVKYGLARTGVALYDLESDPGESVDLAGRHPEVVARLLESAEEAREDLGDSLQQRTGWNQREPGRLSVL